jgi:hypothetical protein
MSEELIPNNGVEVTTPETPAPSWFIDEGIPGTGERPTWLPEKFKSTADMAKSYSELEKKFGQAPESYDLSKSKSLDPDYVPFQEFLDLAKEKRVPKDVIDKMVDAIDKYHDEFSIDYSEEAKKLGENAKERLTTLENWAKANLSEDSFNALSNNLKTADAIKALEELRGKMMSNGVVVPSGNDASTVTVANVADLQKELAENLPKYKTDSKYREDYQKRLAMAAKDSNMVDKVGS